MMRAAVFDFEIAALKEGDDVITVSIVFAPSGVTHP
jgi:hypothetical protein